jgi:hypothetical protein
VEEKGSVERKRKGRLGEKRKAVMREREREG